MNHHAGTQHFTFCPLFSYRCTPLINSADFGMQLNFILFLVFPKRKGAHIALNTARIWLQKNSKKVE